jgi:hypothetical protein
LLQLDREQLVPFVWFVAIHWIRVRRYRIFLEFQ